MGPAGAAQQQQQQQKPQSQDRDEEKALGWQWWNPAVGMKVALLARLKPTPPEAGAGGEAVRAKRFPSLSVFMDASSRARVDANAQSEGQGR